MSNSEENKNPNKCLREIYFLFEIVTKAGNFDIAVVYKSP